MTVVTAFEFNDLVATCRATCKTYRGHRGLGTRAHQTNLFKRGHALDQHFRDDDLSLCWRAIRQAVHGGILDRLDHLGMRVTKNSRTP